MLEAFTERPAAGATFARAAEDLVAHVSQEKRQDIGRVLHDLDSLFAEQDVRSALP